MILYRFRCEKMDIKIPINTISRLSLYRRILLNFQNDGHSEIFSYELSAMANVKDSQVRRDLMSLKIRGNSRRGYHVESLIQRIAEILDEPGGRKVGLAGIGNLGRALITYFGQRPNLSIVAAFDTAPEKTGRVFAGCPCFREFEIKEIVAQKDISLAIIAVPARYAQEAADRFVKAGVRGIINFAPAMIKTPDTVYLEQLDITTSLERASYFTRQSQAVSAGGQSSDSSRKTEH